MKIMFLIYVLIFITAHDNKSNQNHEEQTETRLRYDNFSVVFYEFNGYTITESEALIHYEKFGNDEDDLYKEIIIVKTDTLHLSEDILATYGQLRNTLIQITPTNKSDRFKISYCYFTTLNETTDRGKLSSEENELFNKNAIRLNEQTKYFIINDSSNFYFRTPPDNSEGAGLINGFMSEKHYKEEIKRIKNKYEMKDTLITFIGEGLTSYATLTKDKKLFSYDNDSYLFRIERYNNKKLIETKYIVIRIADGC